VGVSVIVAGVDGSEDSKEALRWALAEAALRRATVRAVHAWSMPIAFGGPYMPPQPYDGPELRDQAQASLDAAVDEVAGEAAPVAVERVVEQGSPADVLVRAAEGADLLVVGSRGHGGFAGLLLGSVGQQCAQHAPCAVVIVRRHTS
jgi:nucleotide-binding universal stress UspA family protein